MSTRVKIAEVGEFNPQRYSVPWLAKLRIKDDRLDYDWQDGWEENPSGGGSLTGFLNEGDYIAYGQKDRFGKNSYRWYGTWRDGHLREMKKLDIEEILRAEAEERR